MEVLKELDNEITKTKQKILGGGLLSTSDTGLSYSKSLSYLKGLEYIDNLIKDNRSSIDDAP